MSKAVLRFSLYKGFISHSTVSLTSSLSGFQGPVVTSGSGVGVCALGASLLLYVVGFVAASSAGAVDFGVTFTETLGSFSSCHLLYN